MRRRRCGGVLFVKTAASLSAIEQEVKSQIEESLASFLLRGEAKRLTPKTLVYYEFECHRFIRFLVKYGVDTLEKIEPDHIRRYLLMLADRGLKSNSQHCSARAVQAWLNWCVKEKLLRRSPMLLVEKPRKDKKILPAFSVDEVQLLLDACGDARETAIVLGLLDSGLRASEFCKLNRGDVDLHSGEVKVLQGKGRKDRVSFFGPRARKALMQYLSSRIRVRPTDPLFVSLRCNQRLGIAGLERLLSKLGEKAGVPHCSPHAFRRTCALWCHRQGWRITEIQRLLGHSDLSVLRQYLDLDDGDIAEAHRAHCPADLL